jgi:hypothetical protein
MTLKSFGCSFIFGSDLADDGSNLPVPTPSNHTWPALLAQHLAYDYECWARPGSGNLQIAERVLTQAGQSNNDFFVIGWSWKDRFDYTSISGQPIQRKWCNWRTIMPIDNNDLARTYYRDLHSEFRDKLCSLMAIKTVIDTLHQKNIPFLMTFMDRSLFEQHKDDTLAIQDLQTSVRSCMTDFEGQTFLEWSRQNNFEISATLHPLESAHRAATNYMITVFDRRKTSGLIQQVLS